MQTDANDRRTDDEASTAAPALLDEGALRSVAIDLVGRPPTAEERERWVGEPRADLVAALLATEEAWDHWLGEQLYYFMLIDQFRPVGTSLDELPRLLAARAMPPRDALHRIALSTSFDLRNPGADTFVTVVMEQFCGIEVQESRRELELGKRAYDGERARFLGEEASTQSDVVRIAARHGDAAEHFVAREHERLTGRPVPKRDLKRVARRVHREPKEAFDLYPEWLASEAYGARIRDGRPVPNHTWVRMIHHDLGRPAPSDEDVESLRSALDGLGDPAPLRSAFLRIALAAKDADVPTVTNQAEAEAFVKGAFQRLLGRPPTPDEARAFRAAALEEDGPRTILYVLMTSEEYERP